MRLAVSGSHGTGKSTLIAAFLDLRPDYAHEPEAFETIGDDVDLRDAEGPTAEGLHALLEHTARALAQYTPGTCVVHERSPADYLAYASASRRSWPKGTVEEFLSDHADVVRSSLRHLDAIALAPVSVHVLPRPDDDERFRKRVDEHLRRVLLDDEYDLLSGAGSPRVVELSPSPSRWLDELVWLTGRESGRGETS